LVAIGMPVRNGSNYIAPAIESLLAQTFTDFELLISDNGSTDNTQEICERFAARDSRVRYYRQPTNIGAAGNFNWVFDNTSATKYFRWNAHDDEAHPEYLEKVVALAERSPEAAVAHCYTHEIDKHGNVTMSMDDVVLFLSERPSDRFGAIFRIWYPAPVWGLMRRDCIARTRKHGRYLGSDLNFVGELMLTGRCVLVPEFLFFVRRHESQFTTALQGTSKKNRLAWFNGNARWTEDLWGLHSIWDFATAAWRHPVATGERLRCARLSVHRGLGKTLYRLGVGRKPRADILDDPAKFRDAVREAMQRAGVGEPIQVGQRALKSAGAPVGARA
jgi:glycosyltransferase involved in cell wall biosynthesis